MALVIGGGINIGGNISISVETGVATASGTNEPPRVWTWTDSAGFGTKYSDPATWAGTDPLGVDFCP